MGCGTGGGGGRRDAGAAAHLGHVAAKVRGVQLQGCDVSRAKSKVSGVECGVWGVECEV